MTVTSSRGGYDKNQTRHRSNNSNWIRRNERIRANQVRVIGADGGQLGVMSTRQALELAREKGLDLVEVVAHSVPPVCRILDFGKYQYEQSKKTKDNKSTASKNKEIKFRMNIEDNDYRVKMRQAEQFLFKGLKTRMSLSLKGREMEHKDLAFALMRRIENDLAHVAQPEGEIKMMGRNLSLYLLPLPVQKRKRLYSEENGPEEEDEDHDLDTED